MKRQERIKNEITELKKLLTEKELDLNEISMIIEDIAKGDDDGHADN